MDEIQEEIDMLRDFIQSCYQVSELSDSCSPQRAAIIMERIVERLEKLKSLEPQ